MPALWRVAALKSAVGRRRSEGRASSCAYFSMKALRRVFLRLRAS
jgi:hypothetical protein